MKSVKFEHGSEIEVESDGGEFKGYLNSVDISFDKDDILDAFEQSLQTHSVRTDEIYGQSPIDSAVIKSLASISGVGEDKAKALYREGYKSIEQIRRASQSELSDIDGIGNALAARIKADVGEPEDFDIDADELVRELEEKSDKQQSFLDKETLMVNMHE